VRLGLSTYTYTWAIGVPGSMPAEPMTAADLLRRAAELGVGVVQIADNIPLHTMPAPELDELADQARRLGIDIEVGTRGIDPEHLAGYLAIAGKLQAKLLRVVVDSKQHHPDPAEATRTLRRSQSAFERAGVVLAIENHDRYTSGELATLVRALGTQWSGICLDTVNSFGALEGPAVVIETLAPLTVNLHLKDFAVRRASHMMGFTIEGRPAGQGQLDIPRLLDTIAAVRPDATAVLELWTPPAASVAETVQRERQWAEDSVEFLAPLLAAA
jgi:sugar phosphate isomerase/epimerase